MLEGLGECFRISMLHIYKVRGCRCYDYDRVIMTEPLGRKNGNIYSSKMAEYILRGVSESDVSHPGYYDQKGHSDRPTKTPRFGWNDPRCSGI